jgi:hypothetical protein
MAHIPLPGTRSPPVIRTNAPIIVRPNSPSTVTIPGNKPIVTPPIIGNRIPMPNNIIPVPRNNGLPLDTIPVTPHVITNPGHFGYVGNGRMGVAKFPDGYKRPETAIDINQNKRIDTLETTLITVMAFVDNTSKNLSGLIDSVGHINEVVKVLSERVTKLGGMDDDTNLIHELQSRLTIVETSLREHHLITPPKLQSPVVTPRGATGSPGPTSPRNQLPILPPIEKGYVGWSEDYQEMTNNLQKRPDSPYLRIRRGMLLLKNVMEYSLQLPNASTDVTVSPDFIKQYLPYILDDYDRALKELHNDPFVIINRAAMYAAVRDFDASAKDVQTVMNLPHATGAIGLSIKEVLKGLTGKDLDY